MQTKITGSVLPVLQVGLEAGETLSAETGQLSWMTPSIQLATTFGGAGASGFFGAIRRAVGGGGLMMTTYSAVGAPGMVAFAARVPGHILPMEVAGGAGVFVHRHGFLCATPGVALGTGFQRSLGAGLFGGEGFVLQHLTGQGTAWIELGGEMVVHDLAPGETLLVHPGHVGAFAESLTFDITLLPGIRNKLFGGDGLFLARVTGPGKIWLQTMTLPNLAHALAPYLGGSDSDSGTDPVQAAEGAIAGAVLKDIFGRD